MTYLEKLGDGQIQRSLAVTDVYLPHLVEKRNLEAADDNVLKMDYFAFYSVLKGARGEVSALEE